MSTTVLIIAGKGFAIPVTMESTPAASRHRPSQFVAAVICDLATPGDTYLPPLVTIFCS